MSYLNSRSGDVNQVGAGAVSVSAAAFDVGDESATRFSREYARKFGASPKQDIPAA